MIIDKAISDDDDDDDENRFPVGIRYGWKSELKKRVSNQSPNHMFDISITETGIIHQFTL